MTPNELIEKIRYKMAKTHAPATFAEIMEWTGYDREVTQALIRKLRERGTLQKNTFGYYVKEAETDSPVKMPIKPSITPLIPLPEEQGEKNKDAPENAMVSKPGRFQGKFNIGMLFTKFLDTAALFIALIVELLVMSVTMIVISPGTVERIAMIGIGFIIVLFAAHAFTKKEKWNKILWFLFAFTSFWINVSFALLVTDVQTQQAETITSIEDDILLQQLKGEAESYEAQIKNLESQYTEARRGATVDSILQQVTDIRTSLRETNNKIAQRITSLGTGESTTSVTASQKTVLSADGIFLAIPTAVRKGRIIQTIIFALIFAGLEITIVSSISTVIQKNKPAQQRQRKGRKIIRRGGHV